MERSPSSRWPTWLRSPSRVHITTSPTPTPTPANFSCSSFKDIQTLIKGESEHEKTHNNPTKKPSIFHRVRISTSILRAWATASRPPVHSKPKPEAEAPIPIPIPNSEHLIIVYFTSLRVVRKTFEECRSVRTILRGFGILIDERDVSMDFTFLYELKKIMGRKCVTLPSVFIGGRYFGGVEEIRRLHENGELKKLIARFPVVGHTLCDDCGGYRFVVCEECDGSCKVYSQKSGGFRCCTLCNSNGLIKCPTCSYILLRCKGS